jgi:solute carrier family 35, member C2
MAFPCPLLLTTMHFGYQWKFAYLLCRQHPDYFGSSRISGMSWGEYLTVALPCGLVTSGDVGLSNLSLVTISITFYTMVKASTPIFVLAWAYVFGIERITCNLLIVVAIIAAGEFLTVMGEVEFETGGFFMCLSASVMSGARWTLVQLKLQTMDPPLKTTVATMRMLAPSMFFSMLLLSLVFERPWNKFETMDSREALHILGLGSLGASFAIAMILCEFYLIMYSSAVILMIGGVLKEMVTIILGVTLFHDQLNRVNLAGCLVVLAGIVFYKVTFHMDKHKNPSGGGSVLPERQYSAVDGSEDDSDALGDVDDSSTRHEIQGLDSPQIQPLSNASQSKQGAIAEQHVELRSRAGILSHSAPTSPVGSPKGLLV